VIAPAGSSTVVTAGFDSAIIVWDGDTGAARRVLRFHDTAVNALASTGGACFLSGGEDTRIALWCGLAAEPRRVYTGHQGPVVAIAVSGDGRSFASAAWDRQARVWPLDAADRPPRVIDGHNGPVNGVAFSADGRAVVTAGYDGQVRLTPLDPSLPALSLQFEAPINSIAVAPDGEIVTAGADGRVLFLGPDLKLRAELQLGRGPLTTIALSQDARQAATTGLRTPVTLIDRLARTATAEILGPGLPVWSLAFAGSGRELFTGGVDRAVRRWDPASGKPVGSDLAKAEEPEKAEPGERGAAVFRACRACHGLTPDDNARAGPTLAGLFGRRIATLPGYLYSEALRKLDIVWTPETVSRLFEVGPNTMTPGTKMPEQTISNLDDRKALVEWLARVTRP
jgi:cytochrome c